MATSTLRPPALLLSSSPMATVSPCEPSRAPQFVPLNRKLIRPLKLELSSSQFTLRPRLQRFGASRDSENTEVVDEDVVKDSSDDSESGSDDNEEESKIMVSLQAYKEAILNGDQSKIVEIEVFLHSIEDMKNSLKAKVAAASAELSIERDRILRISADFDNFRKRTEKERVSLMSNAQGEVVERLLPVLDNFERAKDQIKVETEGENKINSSYQSIYKQFSEILTSLGVETVETVSKNFDPLLHEAIMREESTEFEEGIIIQEFRKGFKIGERLLRPSMVKVSAGPGLKKSEREDIPAAVDSTGAE